MAGAALASGTNRIFAAGSDELRIGLIGCGGRGTSAASQALTCTKRGVKLWAVGNVSGDQPCEQHVHNLDIINWALGAHPVQCMSMGGREVRTGPEHGNIFDHFAVEYEYPNGVRVTSMCRQMAGCTERVSERVVGTKGATYTDQSVGFIEGQNAYKYDGPAPDPYVQEHADLIKSIREGRPVNEGKQVAESTLTAII